MTHPDLPLTCPTAPAPIHTVDAERRTITAGPPNRWQGTALWQCQWGGPGKGTPIPGAVLSSALRITREGRPVVIGKEVLVDPLYATLGLPENGPLTPEDEVEISYLYSLRRLDSIVRLADGALVVRQGEPALSVVVPPPLADGETRLANLFVDHFSDGTAPEVFPLSPEPRPPVTATTLGRIPRTLAKLRAGQPVNVVCWGDSVTEGGDASAPEHRYVDVFERLLCERFPAAELTVRNVSVGGSNSRQWLYPAEFPFQHPERRAECTWERVADAKPDLVTIEFVNDAWQDLDNVRQLYGEILTRLAGLDAEVILITPHFTVPHMMKIDSLRGSECRPYVHALRTFAEEHGIALADASARWEHLWREGHPYVTLLRNGINHPDDRGHRLFAEELIACFAG